MPEAVCSTIDLRQDDIESIVVDDGSADEANAQKWMHSRTGD
jgi:hypothetical protein